MRLTWVKRVFLAVIIAMGVLCAPLMLPILPPENLVAYMRAIHFEPPRTETSHTAALPQIFADQFGWKEMVGSVAHVYHHLQPEDRKRAAIFCQNYGEAEAIDFFGSKLGLPPAIGLAKLFWCSTRMTKTSASYLLLSKISAKS